MCNFYGNTRHSSDKLNFIELHDCTVKKFKGLLRSHVGPCLGGDWTQYHLQFNVFESEVERESER